MFLGREAELSALSDFYNDDSCSIACIYGRKGMGKTALIREFSRDLPHIYFNAYATTGQFLTDLLARACGTGRTRLAEAADQEARLSLILSDIADRADIEEHPLIFIIDSYPFFARAENGFDALLFRFAKEHPQIKFIFCGDSYLSMQKLFFDSKSLWKDSISLGFELTGMGFYESVLFLDQCQDPLEQAAIYGITSGIPEHLLKAKTTARDTIEAVFFADRDLPTLPENILSTELRELSYYNYFLYVLAQGYNRVNQISAAVDKPKDVVVPYMTTLINLGVVTKENPVTEKTNRKKTRYSIVNTFDLFWFRFIAPYIDMYTEGEKDAIFETAIDPGFSEFMDRVFVSMCREYLVREARKGTYPFIIHEIGNWWQNDDERQTTQGFDLVAVGSTEGEEAMVFARCYYDEEPVGISMLKELIDLTKRVKGKKNVFYLVFSKSGFQENTTTVASTIKNIILVSLEDIING